MRRYALLYPLWVAAAIATAAFLSGTPDASVRPDRLTAEAAGARALAALAADDATRWAQHEVVNAAYAKRGEIGPEGRWVILCDASRRDLDRAVVVEIDARSGRALRIRPVVK
ncbi:MAG: hypothetical protein ACYC7A_12270 [Thermoanaerobaculia bacterium]